VLRRSQDDFLGFVSDFIGIPSEAPKEGEAKVRECQEWLAARLREWGWGHWIDLWEAVPGEPNLAVRMPGKSREAKLMFNGHADVVPVEPRDVGKWSYPPYSGLVRDGRVWGRGASDMKGGVAAFLWAAKAVTEQGIELEHDLLLTVNVGEESARPDVGVASVLERGYLAPLVVNAEPSNLCIYRAAMGWLFFEVSVHGRATHPANRYLCVDPSIPLEERPGIDANDKLRLVMNSLAELNHVWAERSRHPLAPPNSTNLTAVHIEGGSRSASLAASACATYAVVFDPSISADEVITAVRKSIEAAAGRDEWLAVNPPALRVPVIDPVWQPFETPADAAGTRDLVQAATQALGSRPSVGSFPGPCDANIIAESGVETIIFGPGDLRYGCHGVDEYVPVEQLLQACEVYANLIVARCVS
jgi:acetylornithine deacetylase/succinyl-diaminopimelate desuccinylase family protein